MKAMKRVIPVVLALVMLLSLAACGESNTPAASSGAEGTGETYKIGVIYPMSGATAMLGNAAADATRVAIEMVNERGGVNGITIEAVFGDGATTNEASTEATRLIDSAGVNVILGSLTSGNANAIRSVTERSNVILWEGSAVSDTVLDGHSGLTYRLCDQGSYRGIYAVKFLAEELSKDLGKEPSELRIAVINEDSSYGESIAEGALKTAEEYGITVAYNEAYDSTTTDVTATVMAIKNANVDAIVAVSYVNDALLYCDTMTQYDAWPDAFLGCGAGWNDPTVCNTLGAEGVEGIFCFDMPSTIDPSMLSTENAELMAEYQSRYKEKTGNDAVLSADVTFMMTWVFLNDVLPRAASFSTEDIVTAIKETNIDQTSMIWSVAFDENGQNTGACSVAMQWQDGALATVWPEAYANSTYRGIPLNK